MNMKQLEQIQNRIYEVRGVRVMLDFDLAALYQVETRVLKQTVRRNLERFPEDFMFEMTENEYNLLIISLTSQIVISNERGGRRYMPFAFTEHGVIMLASLLRSKLELLERNDEDTLAAVNDLSEDVRGEIADIYQAIAALSIKVEDSRSRPPMQKIGYKTSRDEKE